MEGLEGLRALRELVLDRNRIASIGDGAFAGNSQLVELHLEENRLRDLSNIAVSDRLQRLFLGFNRIQVYVKNRRVHIFKLYDKVFEFD